ncbi:MAG: RdgB/HAM1 family non-canonical purine NTP pyrophosphatase [Euzebyaceae bacterium]|nr:RdgB/HAM1 family non-canonical purine NTP pyrophosphatase [Euzebyaceae bacterium]
MTRRVVLATRNPAKLAELRRILAEDVDVADVDLVGADEVDLPAVDETGTTFEENALLKARSAVEACGLPAIADDSGLVVDALEGEPGVRSARYAGTPGDDAANLQLVLERLHDKPGRSAHFVCAAALVAPDGREWTTEGTIEGHIVDGPRGEAGFGYDPVFQPLGELRTTAEMEPAEKDAISHRGKALQALRAALLEL